MRDRVYEGQVLPPARFAVARAKAQIRKSKRAQADAAIKRARQTLARVDATLAKCKRRPMPPVVQRSNGRRR
jgi:hypothetical protein